MPGTQQVQRDRTFPLLLLFVTVAVIGVMVLGSPCKSEVSAAPSSLCVLASKVDSPVKVSFQYSSTVRKSQTAQKYGLSPQPKATVGFYVEILDFDSSFGLYLEL